MTDSLIEYADALAKHFEAEPFFPEIQRARPRVSWSIIVNWLQDKHQISVAESTLKRQFHNWEKRNSNAPV